MNIEKDCDIILNAINLHLGDDKMILDILKDTLLDTIKLIPFLFVAFLIIELIEHKISNKNEKILKKAGRFGPVLGGLLGAIPQCGFSVLASNLYVTRIISLGTLISIYLSTSDEMLPILLSNGTAISKVIIILLIKVIVGIICGFLIDLFIRKKEHEDYHICECEESIIKSSIIHTGKTLIFIFLVTLVLNTLFSFVNQEFIGSIFLKGNVFAPIISSLIGLVPNCASSIIITELYLNNVITLGTCIGGLLTGSGIGILVLFKTNKNVKENIKILLLIYLIGVIVGSIINILGIAL